MTQLRDVALGVALAELDWGVREERANWGPRIEKYLKNCGIRVPAPWCAAFVQYVADVAARGLGRFSPLDAVEREAYVADYGALIKARGWAVSASQALPGDLVLYNFGGSRWDHIGILASTVRSDGGFDAIEGNTNDAGGREGVEVARKTRSASGTRYPVLFARWDR